MVSNQTNTILDFYTQCNKQSDNSGELTKGEKTILECVSIYGLKSQIGLPFDENKTVRMLFAKNFDEEHSGLKNKEAFDTFNSSIVTFISNIISENEEKA